MGGGKSLPDAATPRGKSPITRTCGLVIGDFRGAHGNTEFIPTDDGGVERLSIVAYRRAPILR